MKTFLRSALKLAAVAVAAFAMSGIEAPRAGAEELAKNLFGHKALPAAMPAKSYGFYSKGCFSGGVAIPVDGPTWQAMRLSRNRRWGHPTMIALVEKLSRDAAEKDGWPGLLIGDISQPRGGPMLTGHASHQIGLDADIWLNPMPNRTLTAAERENISAVSMIKKKGLTVDEKRLDAGACAPAQACGELSRGRAHPRPPGHQEEALRDGDGRPLLAAQGQAVLGPRLSFPYPHRLPARLDRLQGAGRYDTWRRLRQVARLVVHRRAVAAEQEP